MTKIELKSLAEYFGGKLPAGKIKDREVRLAIVRLYTTLAKANKETLDEVEELRKSLVGDKEADIAKYAELLRKAADGDEKAKEEAEAMTECVRIDKDFAEASSKLFQEESDAKIAKVPLETLYEALSDCGFVGFSPDIPIAAVEEIFKQVIL